MTFTLRSIVVLSAVPFMLVACGSPANQAAERAIEKETGGTAKVDIAAGTTRVTTSEGTVTVGVQELPAAWPKDIPQYPGSTIQVAGSTTGEGMGATFVSNDAASAVVTYYTGQLAAGGWKIDTTLNAGAMTILAASKGKQNVSMQIGATGTQTSITIGFTEK